MFPGQEEIIKGVEWAQSLEEPSDSLEHHSSPSPPPCTLFSRAVSFQVWRRRRTTYASFLIYISLISTRVSFFLFFLSSKASLTPRLTLTPRPIHFHFSSERILFFFIQYGLFLPPTPKVMTTGAESIFTNHGDTRSRYSLGFPHRLQQPQNANPELMEIKIAKFILILFFFSSAFLLHDHYSGRQEKC